MNKSAFSEEMIPFAIRNHHNAVLHQILIAEPTFTTSNNIELIAVSTSTSDILLKSRQQIEEAICTILPLSTSLRKTVQEAQVVIHNVGTGITRH